MMRRIFLILVVLAILGLAGTVLFLLVISTSVPSAPSGYSPTTFSNTPAPPVTSSPGSSPAATSTGRATMPLGSRIGTLTAYDFLHTGEVGADPQNPGMYYLAGSAGYCLASGACPGGASTTDFNITYKSGNDFFNIVLLREPLGDTRQKAEQFLKDRLGLSEQDMCALYYYVGTLSAVNEFYAGNNLGFSFCPGATPLP